MRARERAFHAGATRRGTAMIEIMIAATLFTVVLLSSMAMVESGRRFSDSTLQITTTEDLAQQMLFRMEHELANATGAEPETKLEAALGAGDSMTLTVTSTDGFPPSGTLILERGTAREERLAYRALGTDHVTFLGLTRGDGCTLAFDHADASELMWAGLAEPLEDQTSPSADAFDGRALENGRPVFFRGAGVGFSYRVPVDPTGGNDPLDGDELTWGAVVPVSGVTRFGWMAHCFVPKDTYEEARFQEDVNRDGDRTDVFEVGQIRRYAWDTNDPSRVEDLGLGPSNVLQERCAYGSDLDGDGFEDPIFLWDSHTNLLHVRLFLLGRTNEDQPIVRTVESVMYLRNEPET